MPEALSKVERRILDYLVDYLRKHTYQPSIREIGKRFGIKSTKTVSEHLQALADKGFIERESSRSRGVRIVGLDLDGITAVSIPIYGKIAAGDPVLLREHVSGSLTVDPGLLASRDSFFLELSGDSMEQVGMFDRDLVLIEPVDESVIADGDIVAARLGGEATVKRYFRRDDQVVLEPANVQYAPIFVREYEDFTILGRVAALVRRMTSTALEH